MSDGVPGSSVIGACTACLRRGWLLAQLSAVLDRCACDRMRLFELLELADEDLLRALGGRRREELAARYAAFEADELRGVADAASTCGHCDAFPPSLHRGVGAGALHVAGAPSRLAQLCTGEIVAITGASRASDYGMVVARELGRGLAASGVTVACVLEDGIAAAALHGALEGGGALLAFLGGGLETSCRARHRGLLRRVRETGCVLSQLPRDCDGRRWGLPAAERLLSRLAALVVVVEATNAPRELSVARMALGAGRVVAAVPGRVGSRLAAGPHALLHEGAELLCATGDALELLSLPPTSDERRRIAGGEEPQLAPALRAVLEAVAAGVDTPDRLARLGMGSEELLCTLSRLELSGLLARGDGGRYLRARCV